MVLIGSLAVKKLNFQLAEKCRWLFILFWPSFATPKPSCPFVWMGDKDLLLGSVGIWGKDATTFSPGFEIQHAEENCNLMRWYFFFLLLYVGIILVYVVDTTVHKNSLSSISRLSQRPGCAVFLSFHSCTQEQQIQSLALLCYANSSSLRASASKARIIFHTICFLAEIPKLQTKQSVKEHFLRIIKQIRNLEPYINILGMKFENPNIRTFNSYFSFER